MDATWPRAAASAAIFRDETVLLVERGKGAMRGLWSLPGGHIEPGETARAAAAREVAEETAIVAEIVGLVDVNDVIAHDEAGALRAHYLIAVHYGRWVSGEPQAGSDSVAAVFVPLSRLENYTMTPHAADFIRRAAERLAATQ